MSVSSERAQLLEHAREEADKAHASVQKQVLVALARSRDLQDIDQAIIASQDSEYLRATLATHLIQSGLFEKAISLLEEIQDEALRGFVSLALVEATKQSFSEISLQTLSPRFAARIAFLLSTFGTTIDPEEVFALEERSKDELERSQVLVNGIALSILLGQEEKAKKLTETLSPWAVDDLHFSTVEAYARTGRTEDARSYARALSEDIVRMECYLRQLAYTEDRVTAVLARSLLNLSRVPRSYALTLACQTKTASDIERAEQFVWQELELNSIFGVLSLVKLGKLVQGKKEAERAREEFLQRPEEDSVLENGAKDLSILLTKTKDYEAAEDFIQQLNAPSLKKQATKGALQAAATMGNASWVVKFASYLESAEERVGALSNAAALIEKTADAPVFEKNLSKTSRKNQVDPKESSDPLDLPMSEDFEDDSTFDGKQRRAATDLVKLLDVVPDKTPLPRNTPELDAQKEISISPDKRKTPDEQVSSKASSPILSSGRLVLQNNVSVEESTPGPISTKPENALEEVSKLITHIEGNHAKADIKRLIWFLSKTEEDLKKAIDASKEEPDLCMNLGISLILSGYPQQAKALARKIPDGEERGRILAALAKKSAQEGEFFLAESEILFTQHPFAKALILLEVAKISEKLDRIEDAEIALSKVSDESKQTTAASIELATVYAAISRPARALRVGGETSRLPIVKTLLEKGKRDEASLYLEGIHDQTILLQGLLSLTLPGKEDPILLHARSVFSSLEHPKEQLNSSLRLAKASELTTDIERAMGLTEKYLVHTRFEDLENLLLYYEVSQNTEILTTISSLLSNHRNLSEKKDAWKIREFIKFLVEANPSGEEVISFLELMGDNKGRSIAAEASARFLAQNGLYDLALHAARLSPDPLFAAYSLLAVSAALQSKNSPYEYSQEES